jgi:hypothetical protein
MPGTPAVQEKSERCDIHARNRFVAKLIPVLLIAITSFATWVYLVDFCSPPPCHTQTKP